MAYAKRNGNFQKNAKIPESICSHFAAIQVIIVLRL